MPDYSEAAENAADALTESTEGGFVEEYEIRRGGRRVKRGNPVDQVDAAIKLDAIAARRSGGIFRGARIRPART